MANATNLVDLFKAITTNLQQDRETLNALDHHDRDTGTNMTENFQLVTAALEEQIAKDEHVDVGTALSQAAAVLRERGHGRTAPIYAQGLEDAGQRLKGQQGFGLDDLLPLLEGLLSGTQRATGQEGGQGQQGSGSLVDALLPGIMGYMESKRQGRSDAEALLRGLMAARRGSTGTAQSPQGYGGFQDQDTTGKIDPGAAGAGSLLEGLFGGLLSSLLRGRQQQDQQAPQQQPDRDQGFGLDDLLGGFFGRQGGDEQRSIQLREPPVRM